VEDPQVLEILGKTPPARFTCNLVSLSRTWRTCIQVLLGSFDLDPNAPLILDDNAKRIGEFSKFGVFL